MSGNNSQLRQTVRDSENTHPNQDSTTQKLSDAQDFTSQKPKTSANHRTGPVTIGHYVLGRSQLIFRLKFLNSFQEKP